MLSIVFRCLVAIFLALAPFASHAAGPTIYDVRLGSDKGNARLVIETSRPVTANITENGNTAVIMFDPFSYKGQIPNPNPSLGIIGVEIDGAGGHVTVRFKESMTLVQKSSLNSTAHKNATRLVFDFAPGGKAIRDQAKGGTVLDPPRTLGQLRETRQTKTVETVTTEKDTPTSGSKITETQTTVTTETETIIPDRPSDMRRSGRNEPLVVVIDAGHGGKDPGARSPAGLREKDITLAMARALRKELQSRGHTAYLTRETDIFIPLRERVNIGRRHKADLFISVHADSMGNGSRTTRGASVYTLSDVASDKESEKLAARENQADIIGGLDLSHEDKDVANILIDLAMRDTMNQSKKLANSLVRSFNESALPMLTPAHRFAGFAVLKAADVPSILVELGFLSNPEESELLNNEGHRARLARGIADSVDIYAERYRPRN